MVWQQERLEHNRLARAQRGDEDAFAQLTGPYRRELQLHCYRIVGSLQDAEDLLQETLLAAWRGLEQFEGRSSLRAWLYTIATNRCLNALRDRDRRPQSAPGTGRGGGRSPIRPRASPRSLASALPRLTAGGPGRRRSGARGPLRGQGDRGPGLRVRPPAPGAPPARGARPARCARVPRRRGRRHARLQRGLGQQRPATRAREPRKAAGAAPRAAGRAEAAPTPISSDASPTPSSATTSTAWSRC